MQRRLVGFSVREGSKVKVLGGYLSELEGEDGVAATASFVEVSGARRSKEKVTKMFLEQITAF